MEMKEDQDSNDLVDKLFDMAMQGHWDMSDESISKNYDIDSAKREIAQLGVVKAYAILSDMISKNYDIASARRETALHVAVAAANEETEHVSEILEGISKPNLSKILRMRNFTGITPLHLAAAMGKTYICWLIVIASEDKSLIEEKNDQGETPLFVAAHWGHEDAFFYLEYEFGKKEENMLINNSGDTVLHSAIYGQHFRLAIPILLRHPDLADEKNEKGLTPLHVLALQSWAFESSSFYRSPFDLIFYKCMPIRKETWEDRKDIKDIEEIDRNRKSPKCPKNYRTCFDVYEMLKGFFAKTWAPLTSCRDCGASRERMDPNMSSLEAGNGEHNRNNGQGYTEKGGQSTTICHLVFQIFKYILFMPLYFLRKGWLRSISNKKRRHKLAKRLLNELLNKTSSCEVAEKGTTSESRASETAIDAPPQAELEQSGEPFARGETPLLTAARLGIVEVVRAILTKFPRAIHDKDRQRRNAVLLAAENRRSKVYKLLTEMILVKESILCQVDADGNSALHLASRYNPNWHWLAPGPALQMKWEIIWHLFVKTPMPSNVSALRNKHGKTAKEIFIESHIPLRKEGKDTLTSISTSYSVISTLVAAAALATSLNIPGGYSNGAPEFKSELAFSVFSISSVVALCTSMSALVFFMAILTTQDELGDLATTIPNRLQFGLMFLFASIASMLVSFSSSFYLSVKKDLEHAAYPIFMAMCLPVTIFVVEQLPLYLRSSFKIPEIYDQDIYVR